MNISGDKLDIDTEAEVLNALREEAKVTIYSKDNCPFCVRAKMLLEKKGFEYEEIDVLIGDNRQQLIERVKSITGFEPKTVPQIFFGHDLIGGFDDLDAHFKKIDG